MAGPFCFFKADMLLTWNCGVKMAKNKGLTFFEKEKKINKNFFREVFSTVFFCFAAVLLAFVLNVFFGLKTNNIGVSMEPTFVNGQEVLIDRFIYKLIRPSRGSVIVFLPKGNENSHNTMKRVVGLPGETVQIVNGYIYINGQPLEDENEFPKMEDGGIAQNPIILGHDEYFVLGDNRNNSEDSRSGDIGPVKKDFILGRAWLKLTFKDQKMELVK